MSPASRFGEIETLVRARYPLIQVVSWEEGRVLREIAEMGRKLNKKVLSWSINDGIMPVATGDLKIRPEGLRGTKDPLMAVRHVLQENEPSIYVFKDLHRYTRESPITRALRDLADHLRSTYTSVILLSPALDIPAELEKDISIVDYPLPSRDHIRHQLRAIAADLRGNPNLTVNLEGDAEEALVNAAVGLTLNEAENVFAKTLVSTGRLSRAEVPVVFSEKKQIIRKTGLLEYIETEEELNGVGGLDYLKNWVVKRREGFTPEARRYGLPTPKGLLILGVQGCGKSLCAKAVPKLWEVPLLRLDMGQLFGSLVGSSEQNVRRAIQIAESVQPVVLWIDEIDKGFSGLDSSTYSDAGTTSRVFGSILTWLQEKTSSVFVIATANNVENLPPELLRKGRFDEIFFVDLPNPAERENILRIHIAKRRRDPAGFDIPALARAAEGFSGAEIEQAVVSAMFDSFTQKQEVASAHILHAIQETVPLSKLMAEGIEKRRAWARGRTRPAT